MERVVLPFSQLLGKWVSRQLTEILYFRKNSLAPYNVTQTTEATIKYLIIFVSTLILAYFFIHLYIPNKIVSPTGRTSITVEDGNIIIDNYQKAEIVSFDVELNFDREREGQYYYRFGYEAKFRANTNEKVTINSIKFKYSYNNGQEFIQTVNKNIFSDKMISENKNSKYSNTLELMTTQPISTAKAQIEIELNNTNGFTYKLLSSHVINKSDIIMNSKGNLIIDVPTIDPITQ